MVRDAARLLLIAACVALPCAATAARIVVDTTSNTDDGNCTLAEAVQAANGDVPVDACTAGSGDDEIDLRGLSGTIELTTLLNVSQNLVILGPGARQLRLSGSTLSSLSGMISNFNADLAISDVTIGDHQGEGTFRSCLIPCTGHLLLERVRVTGCSTGPTLIPFPDTGSGGAMSTNCSEGDVTIRDSLFDANSAAGGGGSGGAIWWAGRDLTIVNTTFSGNSSATTGGALWSFPNGATGGEAILRNVTFSGNSANSGAAILVGAGTTTLGNSVLAESASGGNCAVAGGALISEGHNLSDDASCGLFVLGDQIETPSGLSALGDHGGPTDTHTLLPDSALEDAGDPGGCIDENNLFVLPADQRGVARPLGAACDIGAVEAPKGCGGPLAGCATAQKAQLRVANGDDAAKRQLTWSWKKGGALALPELGVPSTDTDYSVCVYDDVDENAELVLAMAVAPGAPWKAAGTKGWKYKDKAGASDGVQSIALKVGAAGKSAAQVTARGQSLPELAANDESELFDQDSAVTVQLVNEDGTCWSSAFEAAGTRRNDAQGFEAKAP
jgi:hypothetical protein